MRPIVSWGLSAAFHGLLAALAVTRIAGEAPPDPPPGRTPWEAEGSERMDVEIVLGTPPSQQIPRQAAVDRWSGTARVKGESLDFVSDRSFRGKVVYDAVGSGAGAGGRYGASLHSENDGSGAPSPVGIIAHREPVSAGLYWLARHRDPAGGWTRKEGCACPDEGADRLETATVALAVLAFLEAGFRPGIDARIGDLDAERVVREGLSGLRARRGRYGWTGSWAPDDHLLATLAYVHAYRLTRASVLVDPAEEALSWVPAFPPRPGEPARTSFWRSVVARCARETDLQGPRDAPPGAAPDWPEGDPHARLSEALSRRLAPVDRDRILRRQRHRDADCRAGSWDPVGGASRAYATSLAVLTLLQR